MLTENDFLQEIQVSENPLEALLVLKDWFEERGNPKARLILHSLVPDSSEVFSAPGNGYGYGYGYGS